MIEVIERKPFFAYGNPTPPVSRITSNVGVIASGKDGRPDSILPRLRHPVGLLQRANQYSRLSLSTSAGNRLSSDQRVDRNASAGPAGALTQPMYNPIFISASEPNRGPSSKLFPGKIFIVEHSALRMFDTISIPRKVKVVNQIEALEAK